MGSRIPNVDELAAEFGGGARHYARGAWTPRAGGVTGATARQGHFRAQRSPTEGYAHKLAIDWQSLISAHEGAKIEVIERRVVSQLPSFDLMKGKPAPKYQMMRRLHMREGRPYLVGRFYLEFELFKQGPPLQFRRLPTLPILHKIAGARIAKAWQTLTIGMADVEIVVAAEDPTQCAGGQGRPHRRR